MKFGSNWHVVSEEKTFEEFSPYEYVKQVAPVAGPFLVPGLQFEQSW